MSTTVNYGAINAINSLKVEKVNYDCPIGDAYVELNIETITILQSLGVDGQYFEDHEVYDEIKGYLINISPIAVRFCAFWNKNKKKFYPFR